MLNIKKLLPKNFYNCYNLITTNNQEKIYFKKLGWGINQFKNQLIKENNFSLALFDDDLMISFIIGDIISIEKIIEYEILLIYVNFNYRQLSYASKLLNEIELVLKSSILKKIYLEVSLDNIPAIKLYEKNNFIKTDIRKKYYNFNDKKVDAFIFEKIINE